MNYKILFGLKTPTQIFGGLKLGGSSPLLPTSGICLSFDPLDFTLERLSSEHFSIISSAAAYGWN